MKKNDKNSINNKKTDENDNVINNLNDDSELAKLNPERRKYYMQNEYKEKIHLRPELKKLQKEILTKGSDIPLDAKDDDPLYKDRPKIEKIGHKIYIIFAFIEHYLHAYLSIALACYVIYYTNLFYNLYFNEKIARGYLYISAFLFIVDILIFCYLYIYLAKVKKIPEKDVDKQFEEMTPLCTLIGLFAFIFLNISMWSVYRYYTIPIVFSIFWGLIMSGNIVQSGALGNIFFLAEIITMLFSYKFIKGKGKTYY